MQLRVLCSVFVIIFIAPFFTASAQVLEVQERVRVLLEKTRTSIKVSGLGLVVFGTNPTVHNNILPKRKEFQITRGAGKWLIEEVGSGWEIVESPALMIHGENIRIEDTPVVGDLRLVVGKTATPTSFSVVAEISMEDYLKGVLPSEMPISWPIEALKAQAVAARSYVMNEILMRSDNIYHVDTTINHQVYDQMNYAGATQAQRDKIDQAIGETRGVYLATKIGKSYRTYFHSDCGGRTEEPKSVWGFGEKNGMTRDEGCALNTKSHWRETISREALEKGLAKALGVSVDEKLIAITADSFTGSGRVYEMLFKFSRSMRTMNAQEFRRTFGFNQVKSTNFTMKLSEKSLALEGRGHGHGAGMCQNGARFMAMAGARYESILKKYYPNAILKRPDLLAEVGAQ